MKKVYLLLFSIHFSIPLLCQTEIERNYNLDFECIENHQPYNWKLNLTPDYTILLDSIIKKNGKYSLSIENEISTSGYAIAGLIIADNYDGKVISLSGYVKTENIEGYASLLIRIDPSIGVKEVKLTGSTDWQKLEIPLEMDSKNTSNYAIGCILAGKGKVWFDDLKILIDGKDINEIAPIIQSESFATSSWENQQFDKIEISDPDSFLINNLKDLGLIWGFLKYYHPSISNGNYNWDHELFKILPILLKANDTYQKDSIFVSWINGLGLLSEEIKNKSPKSIYKMKPDNTWIHKSGFSKDLSILLSKIENSYRKEEHYYLKFDYSGNILFKNEDPYSQISYPHIGLQLLSLYRYWNIVNYFYPYKYLIEKSWQEILIHYIPKFINANDEKEYTLTVLELITEIRDTHSTIHINNEIISDFFGKNYTPIILSFIEDKPVITDFFNEEDKQGLKKGDIITKINNIPVTDKINFFSKYIPASNHSVKLRDMADIITRTNDTIIDLEFLRNGEIVNKTIKVATNANNITQFNHRYNMNAIPFRMINEEIAYLNNGTLKRDSVRAIWNKIKNTQALIIDNRNYPFDYPIFELGNYLMPYPIPFMKYTIGNIVNPGFWEFIEDTPITIGYKNDDYYKGKIVILINELTQSSSETHTMAYKVHPNALLIGSRTAGTNGDITQFFLPGGIITQISTIGIYLPDGSDIQRIGIVPDIEISPTISGVIEERDEILEKAIKVIFE